MSGRYLPAPPPTSCIFCGSEPDTGTPTCSACGNWALRLDNDVRALLDAPGGLDVSGATAQRIAFWACQQAMLRAFADDDRGVAATNTRWMFDHRESLEPPANWTVLLGRSETDVEADTSDWFRMLGADGGEELLIQQRSVRAGRLVLLTVGVSGPPRAVLRIRHAFKTAIGNSNAVLRRLWPNTEAFDWPEQPRACPAGAFTPLVDFVSTFGAAMSADMERVRAANPAGIGEVANSGRSTS